jgi:hypothetical protein
MQHDEDSTMTSKPAPKKPAARPTIPRKKPPRAMDDYGRHEVLHMSNFLCNSVGNELMEHAQIQNNPAWQALAETAHQALFDLYQAIGEVHLGGIESRKPTEKA